MSKKSRRQRQRAKQRNYAQLYNQPAQRTEPSLTASQTAKVPPRPTATTADAAWDQLQRGKKADLWDSLIFAGAIFVVFIAIYYINWHSPFLPQFGLWVTNLFGSSLWSSPGYLSHEALA